jgi:hypothetical protein
MKTHLATAAMAATLLLAAPAQALEVSAGARVSTLGIGLEAATSLSPKWDVRAVVNGFDHDQDFDDDDGNQYNAKLKLFTLGALADYHPFEGRFRLTAGALYNGFKVDARTKNDQTFSYETDDYVYNGTGRAAAAFDFPKFAPYLGLGWGRPVKADGGLWFSFDVGVMFQGSLEADLDIQGSGTLTDKDTGATQPAPDFANDPTVQQDIANYERQLEDDAKDFKYWPVVGFGLGYQF